MSPFEDTMIFLIFLEYFNVDAMINFLKFYKIKDIQQRCAYFYPQHCITPGPTQAAGSFNPCIYGYMCKIGVLTSDSLLITSVRLSVSLFASG